MTEAAHHTKPARPMPFAIDWKGEGPRQYDNWQKVFQGWADTTNELWTAQADQANEGLKAINKELAEFSAAKSPRDLAHRLLNVQRHAFTGWIRSMRLINDHMAKCCFDTANCACDLASTEGLPAKPQN
ncbi:hypothetical protein ACFSM5_08565 [Lacibacterium aquatile]|uniref:Phasin domain-containing protein n=1 Tax=Lacibacterium aquatile TaxID=1168082 RepID=A0ABW5DPH7_9PROT